MNIYEVLLVMLAVVMIALVFVVVGGWLVFRSKAQPGEGFIVQPKGQAFTIPDATDAANFPDHEPSDAELQMAQRADEFWKGLRNES
ncbi:MAG: hypothetical protein KBA28_05365 [Syntrophaceae bacterium]|jgi:hypothetical protein|nr:hypothetical protein [Syntrophaceae bacterium]